MLIKTCAILKPSKTLKCVNLVKMLFNSVPENKYMNLVQTNALT